MGFPNTSVLDTFVRANEGPPPSASWDYPLTSINAGIGLKVSANQLIPNDATKDNDSYWKTAFGANCEAYFTVAVLPAGITALWLHLRGTNQGAGGVGGASINGYEVDIAALNGTATLKYFRADSGTYTQLGATETPGNFVAGDKFGAQMIEDVLQAWWFHNGSWATYGTSRTDSTYRNGGVISAGMGADATARIIDFGGGELPPGSGRIREFGAIGWTLPAGGKHG